MTRRVLLVLFAVFLTFSWGTQAHAEGKTKTGVTKVYALSSDRISEYIDKTKGQKRILYIYTSWCGYCRIMMPKIMDLESTKKGSVIAVSVDKDYKKYKSYAKNLGTAPFPLIWNKSGERNLQKKLSVYNVMPWRGYPTLIFLDENSMSVGRGHYTAEQAAKFVLGE